MSFIGKNTLNLSDAQVETGIQVINGISKKLKTAKIINNEYNDLKDELVKELKEIDPQLGKDKSANQIKEDIKKIKTFKDDIVNKINTANSTTGTINLSDIGNKVAGGVGCVRTTAATKAKKELGDRVADKLSKLDGDATTYVDDDTLVNRLDTGAGAGIIVEYKKIHDVIKLINGKTADYANIKDLATDVGVVKTKYDSIKGKINNITGTGPYADISAFRCRRR